MTRTTVPYKRLLAFILTLGLLLPVGKCACAHSSPTVSSQNHCQPSQTSRHDCKQNNKENTSSSCCCSKMAALDQKVYLVLQNSASEQSFFATGQANGLERPDQIVSSIFERITFSEYPRFYSSHIYLLNSSLLI